LAVYSFHRPGWVNYDGFVFYYQGNLRGRIDFAVYDTEHAEYGDEYLDAGITPPGEGQQYIYAYQIFNDYLNSEESVAYFAVLGIDEATIDLDSISSQEDPQMGIAPGDQAGVEWVGLGRVDTPHLPA